MERLAPFSAESIECPACGLPARRSAVNRLSGFAGLVPVPTAQRYINLPRAIEAQHELVYEARKQNVELPDFWKIAKGRVAAGEVAAIE